MEENRHFTSVSKNISAAGAVTGGGGGGSDDAGD